MNFGMMVLQLRQICILSQRKSRNSPSSCSSSAVKIRLCKEAQCGRETVSVQALKYSHLGSAGGKHSSIMLISVPSETCEHM